MCLSPVPLAAMWPLSATPPSHHECKYRPILQLYVRDLTNNTTVLVSANLSGKPAGAHSYDPEISADGRFVAFASEAQDLASPPVDSQIKSRAKT